jgi:hypothetical protein
VDLKSGVGGGREALVFFFFFFFFFFFLVELIMHMQLTWLAHVHQLILEGAIPPKMRSATEEIQVLCTPTCGRQCGTQNHLHYNSWWFCLLPPWLLRRPNTH